MFQLSGFYCKPLNPKPCSSGASVPWLRSFPGPEIQALIFSLLQKALERGPLRVP